MADRSRHLSAPAYEVIANILREAVRRGNLPAGTVLLEGAIAELVGSSRTPVKQAIASLEHEGLVRRFDGRGVLAGRSGEPLRVPLTLAMLGLGAEATTPKVPAWREHYYDFESTIILRATFGAARINELALARYYGVGRTVAGDLLDHGARNGIVARDSKSRWWINPLDEPRFRNLYELRLLLEPAALQTAMDRISADELGGMQQRLADVAGRFPRVEAAELDQLEEDLHVDLLSFGSNPEILEALNRTRCVLVAGKHIQRAVRGGAAIDEFMGEHLRIIASVAAGDHLLARRYLCDHLTASSLKAVERLRLFRDKGSAVTVPYVIS